jgi:TorA maturation chaperone TorD
VAEASGAHALAPGLGDLFALLAAAFATPPATLTARAWCESLAEDLGDVGAEIELETASARSELRRVACGALGAEPWLVEYSRLFLVPPVHVTLNTGMYLEGGLAGVSAQMIAQCYATAGFAQREDFRDLPDHVAIQLEFLAALLERHAGGDGDALAMAREFSDGFVAHWVGPLQSACAKAGEDRPAAAVYAELAAVLRGALDRLR